VVAANRVLWGIRRAWGFFGFVTIFLILLSPFSTYFFQGVARLSNGIVWMNGIWWVAHLVFKWPLACSPVHRRVFHCGGCKCTPHSLIHAPMSLSSSWLCLVERPLRGAALRSSRVTGVNPADVFVLPSTPHHTTAVTCALRRCRCGADEI
jgi:hypothetical protein